MTPEEYRRKHKKCKYCKYMRHVIPKACLVYPFDECVVKDSIIYSTEIPRPFCKCFEPKEIEL